MSDQSLIVQPIEAVSNGSLVKLIQESVPRLQKGAANTLLQTKAIITVTEENLEEVKQLIVPVRGTYDKMVALRKSMTEQTDALKQFLMTPEKEVEAEMERLRSWVQKIEQLKINRNEEAIRIASLNRLREQSKAEIIAKIKLNVTEVIINRCSTVDKESLKFFSEVTDIAEFDKKADTYKSAKWRLKQEEYEKCFIVSYNTNGLTPVEYKEVSDKLKEDMTYEKINAMYLEKANPILSNWKSKIPQIREEWQNKFKAGIEERAMLEEESKKRNEVETLRQQEYLNEQKTSMQASVQTEQVMAKVEADFTEQAVVQSLDKVGPTKKVLKFNSEKPVAELAEIIYHCFMHPKFPGIIKRDKEKKPVLDEQGRMEYHDSVNFFIDFFVKNCDAEIKNTQIFSDSKVIIRK